MRSDNICGRAQGIATALQAYERYEMLLAGKDTTKDDLESPDIRTAFVQSMERAII